MLDDATVFYKQIDLIYARLMQHTINNKYDCQH